MTQHVLPDARHGLSGRGFDGAALGVIVALRVLRRYLRMPGLGRVVMLLARRVPLLQSFPVHVTGGRVLILDLREIQNMPYLFHGTHPYEKGEEVVIRRLVSKGQAVVDIGANVGWYSTLLADLVGHEGRVYAFEPAPAALRTLRLTAHRYPQLVVMDLALSDRRGSAVLHIPSHLGNASLREVPGTVTTHVCDTITLDEFLLSCGSPEVACVKCDVEGAELQVLTGARQLMRREFAPTWVVELNTAACARFGHSRDDIVRRFEDCGYVGWFIDSGTGALRPLSDDVPSVANALFVPRARS